MQPVKLRTQRWPQLLTVMLALACSVSLVLLGSQRLQADHLDLAGPSAGPSRRSSVRVDVAATAQCLASNKLLRPSPSNAIGPDVPPPVGAGGGVADHGQQGPATRAGEGPLRGPDTSWPRRDAATRHTYQVSVKRPFLKPSRRAAHAM